MTNKNYTNVTEEANDNEKEITVKICGRGTVGYRKMIVPKDHISTPIPQRETKLDLSKIKAAQEQASKITDDLS